VVYKNLVSPQANITVQYRQVLIVARVYINTKRIVVHGPIINLFLYFLLLFIQYVVSRLFHLCFVKVQDKYLSTFAFPLF